MGLTRYLAQTAAEFAANPGAARETAWMACHFSPYGTGLSNLPTALPQGAMVILNDRTPVWGHDPEVILAQLQQTVESLRCRCVLLDFQRPENGEYAAIARRLTTALPCPVGVTSPYARALDCPVFLPPVPLRQKPAEYLRPWQGREIWLEAALDGEEVALTPNGAVSQPLPHPGDEPTPLADEDLCCHYRIDLTPDSARFTLRRTSADLDRLLQTVPALGVTRSVGLWQELRNLE